MKIAISIILLALTPFFTLTAQEKPIVSHEKIVEDQAAKGVEIFTNPQ